MLRKVMPSEKMREKKGKCKKKEEKMGKVEKINIMEKNCQNNQK